MTKAVIKSLRTIAGELLIGAARGGASQRIAFQQTPHHGRRQRFSFGTAIGSGVVGQRLSGVLEVVRPPCNRTNTRLLCHLLGRREPVSCAAITERNPDCARTVARAHLQASTKDYLEDAAADPPGFEVQAIQETDR